VGYINGRVTGSTGNLSGISVYAYSYVGGAWVQAGATSTGSSGTYGLALAPGSYRLYYTDTKGNWSSEYYSDKTTIDTADDVTVDSAVSTTANAVLSARGKLTGTVSGGGSNLRGITVTVYSWSGSAWTQVAVTSTSGSGTYGFSLVPGTYRVGYRDGAGNWITQYYNNVVAIDDGTDVPIVGLGTVTINPTLVHK